MHYAAMLYIVNKHYFDHYMYLIWLCATHPISSNQALYYQKKHKWHLQIHSNNSLYFNIWFCHSDIYMICYSVVIW